MKERKKKFHFALFVSDSHVNYFELSDLIDVNETPTDD